MGSCGGGGVRGCGRVGHWWKWVCVGGEEAVGGCGGRLGRGVGVVPVSELEMSTVGGLEV